MSAHPPPATAAERLARAVGSAREYASTRIDGGAVPGGLVVRAAGLEERLAIAARPPRELHLLGSTGRADWHATKAWLAAEAAKWRTVGGCGDYDDGARHAPVSIGLVEVFAPDAGTCDVVACAEMRDEIVAQLRNLGAFVGAAACPSPTLKIDYKDYGAGGVRAIAAFAWWAYAHSLFCGANTRNVRYKDEGSFGSSGQVWMAMKQSWGVWREQSVTGPLLRRAWRIIKEGAGGRNVKVFLTPGRYVSACVRVPMTWLTANLVVVRGVARSTRWRAASAGWRAKESSRASTPRRRRPRSAPGATAKTDGRRI
jgi:hypothetical protein